MENVAEMRNGFDQQYTETISSKLSDAGYCVSHIVLNAADFGVPQRRRRAFFLASRDGIRFAPPDQTHARSDTNPSLFGQEKHVTVWDAIGDLPSVRHDSAQNDFSYPAEPRTPYQRIMREQSSCVLNHRPRKLAPLQLERLKALKPGQSLRDLPAHLSVRGGYSGAYGRLTKDMIAPTITRWVFHPGSGRWGHPVDDRVITIREVARLQSFPDTFSFEGSYNDQAGQLGNAVPPLLIRRIVESMLAQLGGKTVSMSLTKSSTDMRSVAAGS